MTRTFYCYNTLEYLDPEDFYAGAYTIEETMTAEEDGEAYDIVFDLNTGEYRCTNV